MGIFNFQSEALFKDVPGGRVFYPHGAFGRGYLVQPEQERSLKRIRALTLRATLAAGVLMVLWVSGVVVPDTAASLASEDDFGSAGSAGWLTALPLRTELLVWAPVLPLVLIAMADVVLVRRQLRTCPRSAVRLTWGETYRHSSFIRPWWAVQGVGYGLFACGMGIADLVGWPWHSSAGDSASFFIPVGLLLIGTNTPSIVHHYRASRHPDRLANSDFDANLQRGQRKPENGEIVAFIATTAIMIGVVGAYILFKTQPGLWDAEIAEKTKAIEQNPENASGYLERGRTYREAGDYDKAIADEDRAIALDPADLAAYVERASISLLSRTGYDEALADDDKALAINPKYAEAYVSRAEIRIRMKDFEQAIADATTAIAIARKPCMAYVDRSEAYNHLGRYDLAVADTTLAMSMCNFGFGYALDSRGYAYEQQGRRDEAIADYRASLALWRYDREASAGLRRLGATP
jgi:tetratricopeptide (TPR) repeat protein